MICFGRMEERSEAPVTKLLRDWRGGDAGAFEKIAEAVHRELRRLAASYMSRERVGHTLQPTALVNEACIRLISQGEDVDWENRSHFVAIAAQHMRQILVDHARRRNAEKRGSGQAVVSLDEVQAGVEAPLVELLALDTALSKLAETDQRKAKVMELKYFGGLGAEEIATVLSVSVKTVEKDVQFAKAWLRSALGRSAAAGV